LVANSRKTLVQDEVDIEENSLMMHLLDADIILTRIAVITTVFREYIRTPHMNIKNGSGLPNVEHSLMSSLHACMGCSHPQNVLTQADLMPPPDNGLNSYNSPQLSVEVGVTSIEVYERGYVATDVRSLTTVGKFAGW
jgi:hypothetical protein